MLRKSRTQLQVRIVSYGVILVGFWIGITLNRRKIRFLRSRDWRKAVGASLVGVVGLLALRKGLPELGSTLSPDGTIFRLLNQSLILGFYVTAVAPWIFQILKLGEREAMGVQS